MGRFSRAAALGLAAAVIAAVAVVVTTDRSDAPAPAARSRLATCPTGYVRVGAGQEGCAARSGPEAPGELMTARAAFSARATAPFGSVAAGAYSSAIAERDAIAGAHAAAVPGADQVWRPLGTPPLIANDPNFGEVNGQGLVKLSGRVQGLAFDPANAGRWFAGSTNGGVWESNDAGASWHSIGDGLPTQVVGAVAYTATGGAKGTIIAATGD